MWAGWGDFGKVKGEVVVAGVVLIAKRRRRQGADREFG